MFSATDYWYAKPGARAWRSTAAHSPLSFHETLASYAPTPLTSLPAVASELGVGEVYIKNESNRLGLPAFKILGASWAVCRALCERYGLDVEGITVPVLRDHLQGRAVQPTLVAATDGNHGRAVARMAALLGVNARIYVPSGLSEAALDGIRCEGATLHEHRATYDDVVQIAAASVVDDNEELLIQDTSWPGYTDVPRWIVDGYISLFHEIDAELARRGVGLDLVVCPAGVGSLAHALVEHYRAPENPHPSLLSVEPETAACVARSLLAGEPVSVDTSFPSIMSGLNCGTPSELGWPTLLAGLDAAVSVSEGECRGAVMDLAALAQDAGPCGAATLAGVRKALATVDRRRELGLGSGSVIVLISTEGLAANPLR